MCAWRPGKRCGRPRVIVVHHHHHHHRRMCGRPHGRRSEKRRDIYRRPRSRQRRGGSRPRTRRATQRTKIRTNSSCRRRWGRAGLKRCSGPFPFLWHTDQRRVGRASSRSQHISKRRGGEGGRGDKWRGEGGGANRAASHHARNRAQEDGVGGGEIRGEATAVLEWVPRKDAEPHNRRYIASPANVLRAGE
ncbi:hypothetical protein F5148DRAFT_779420 [Russula earlei]|uniref:Uncharacterized protein n=1 Tax=Russula earlei TaxID=71964 RepID=A0ACC0UC10_9AGAM|nr:hypothetical protein F5148DRAFT_779420 [Russula earlei]